MSEAKTIYVVTSGEYSDYGINAIFSTRELAEEFIRVQRERGVTDLSGKLTYQDEFEIEEWTLDEAPTAKPGAFEARIWEDGTGRITWHPEHDPNAPAGMEAYDYLAPGRRRVFSGYGETREHARRSAEELRRAVIAGTVVAT